MVSDIIGNIKSKRSFFFEKIVFGLLVSCLVLSHDTEYFSLDIPRKTTSWIISICSTIWVEVYGNPSLTTNIRIYIFFDKTYFTNCLSTNFLFWIPVFFFFLRIFYLSPSPLPNLTSSTSSLLLNFIITYHLWFLCILSLQSSDSFHFVAKLLATSCGFVDAVNDGCRVYG